MTFRIISQRRYGEPKLKPPKELKGFKKIGSVPWGPKCQCPVYITPTHVYLKHRDFFSPFISMQQAKDAGIVDKWNRKFIYNDNFGSVVLRSEAWIRIPLQLLPRGQNLLPQYALCTEMARTVALPEEALFNHDWVYMFEELIKITMARNINHKDINKTNIKH